MCNHCQTDPRDTASRAERALFGLRVLLSELPPDCDLPASGLEPLVSLIHEGLDQSVAALQNYVPRLHPAGEM